MKYVPDQPSLRTESRQLDIRFRQRLDGNIDQICRITHSKCSRADNLLDEFVAIIPESDATELRPNERTILNSVLFLI